MTTAAALDSLLGKRSDFLSFLERRVGDRALAEDILQDAFAKSTDALAQLREHESAVAWFYRVLRNAVIDHHRRNRTVRAGLDRFAQELEAEAPTPEVKAAVCRCVLRLTETLSAEHAEVLRKVEVEDMSVKDYADATGISAGTAGVRLFRARESLRRAVLSSCGSCCGKRGCVDCTCAESA